MIFGLAVTAAASARSHFIFILRDGGGEMRVLASGESVESILTRIGRELGPHDTMNFEPAHRLALGDVLVITRRTNAIIRETRNMPYTTIYRHSPAIRAGQERVVQEGVYGVSEVTMSQYIVNGEVVEEELLSERIIYYSVDRIVESGFRSTPMSPFNFNFEFDENHEPIGYVRVLRNQIATAYWYPPGGITATGIEPFVGHVAVDPRRIPYGSRLFIQTPDGSFIYGYALAVDTGGDLLRGRIDIDLFFPSNAEAWQHGVRRMDVFILPPADTSN